MKATLLTSVVLTAAVSTLAGCCGFGVPEGSVLEGVWQLDVEDDTNLGPTTLTFDSRGNLTQVSIQSSAAVTAVVTDPDADVTVSGSTVTIEVPRLLDGELTFVGTLNSDNTVVTGELTTSVTVGDLLILVDEGAATLTRVD